MTDLSGPRRLPVSALTPPLGQPKRGTARRIRSLLTAVSALAVLGQAPTPTPLVLWVWERPEDLRFADPNVTIAILAGSVRLSDSDVAVRPRLQPALVRPDQRLIGVIHLEADRIAPPTWTQDQRARTAQAVLWLLRDPRFKEVQIDFEVRASQRPVLLDLLADLRSALPSLVPLSMTALASWCDTETWLDTAPVNEVVPMLFRMGPAGEPLRQRIAAGGTLRLGRCRGSVGVAADTPLSGIAATRRIWLFNPQPWTETGLAELLKRLRA